LTNQQGQSVNLQAIEAQTLPNSNASGTLYMQNAAPLNYGEQLIYTSANAGESDSFIVGYVLRPELLNAQGDFIGKLIFSARSMQEGVESQGLVDVFLKSKSAWKSSVEGGHSLKQIRVTDTDGDKNADFIKASFSGNPGQDVRIYQEFEQVPVNEAGQEFDLNALQMNMTGNTAGLKNRGLSRVEPVRSLIYTGHTPEDTFIVSFLMDRDKIPGHAPGLYRGKLKYIVETDSGREEFPIDVQLKVQAVFTLEVSAPSEGLTFSRIFAGTPPQEKEITVTVRSNLGKPYQVLQNFQAPMTNEKGSEFDNKYFTFKVEIPNGQKGRTRFNEFLPVEKGDYPVYSSDGKGSSVAFKIIYQMQGYAQMSPGTFLAPVMFSLNQN
jgi:hypothetical protein